MRLDAIQYSEYAGLPKEWSLARTELGKINLIVGKNAAGKSRCISVIQGLAKVLTGSLSPLFQSSSYRAEFTGKVCKYEYILDIQDRVVVQEMLSRDGVVLLERESGGKGVIWAEKLQSKIDFEAPNTMLAALVRRDAIQHPFFEELYEWADSTRLYLFGSAMGREFFQIYPEMSNAASIAESYDRDVSRITKLYIKAFEEFGTEFDKAIARDLNLLGYECTDVGAQHLPDIVVAGPPLIGLFVKEADLAEPTTQINMSQGMFRVLALLIHLNFCIFRKQSRTILIDDIGEGLDFSRSRAFIAMLIEHSEKHDLQLVMTTNDRFVMNGVPLEYWGLIRRRGGQVDIVNKKNSPTNFSDFENLGLNNFDFFSSGFFEEGLKAGA